MILNNNFGIKAFEMSTTWVNLYFNQKAYMLANSTVSSIPDAQAFQSRHNDLELNLFLIENNEGLDLNSLHVETKRLLYKGQIVALNNGGHLRKVWYNTRKGLWVMLKTRREYCWKSVEYNKAKYGQKQL